MEPSTSRTQGDGGVGGNGSKRSGGGGSGGGGGPGGHSGGGGGAGGGGSPPRGPNNDGPELFDFSSFSQDGPPRTNHKQLTKFCKSPFETKAANQELQRFNGKTGREVWRKKVGMYLHSKNPDMMGLLRWAEQQKDPVSVQSPPAARHNSGPLARLAEDPEVLSYHLWGFLNVSLTDDAWAIFSGVDIENGFEVWRTVVLATTQKSQAEVLRLEDSVLMPDRVRSASDIEKALVEWDALYREYTEAGGCPLSDHRKVGVLMRLLPTILHDDILKEFGRFDNKPNDLRRWIRDRVQWLKWNDYTTCWMATTKVQLRTTQSSLPTRR